MPDFAVTVVVYLEADDELDAAERGWKIAEAIQGLDDPSVDDARCLRVD
jgi:hypothetical protein